MGKKKAEKPESDKCCNGLTMEMILEAVSKLPQRDEIDKRYEELVNATNQRINRIVDAHEKCKSLKGL